MKTETSSPVNLILDAYELETIEHQSSYGHDSRTLPPDVFVKLPETQWANMDWQQVGKPHPLRNYSSQRSNWEQKNGRKMPEITRWKLYNKQLHELFHSHVNNQKMEVRKSLLSNIKKFRMDRVDKSVQKAIELRIWDYMNRKEDAILDLRGKRAFFEGLGLKEPRILMLGAGDGFDAMVLLSIYGGSAHLVDYDDFCMSDRFGKFPADYAFMVRDTKSGYWNIQNKCEFDIQYTVEDIQNLKLAKEFDVVISSGLIEHYSDKYKPLLFHYHKQFLKPGGLVILTASRNYARLRAFYYLMRDKLNFTYRELMSAPQLGLYVFENGFKIIKYGYIKAHNIVIAQER